MGKRLYLSRTPLTRPYFALCSSNPQGAGRSCVSGTASAQGVFSAVEFKPRAIVEVSPGWGLQYLASQCASPRPAKIQISWLEHIRRVNTCHHHIIVWAPYGTFHDSAPVYAVPIVPQIELPLGRCAPNWVRGPGRLRPIASGGQSLANHWYHFQKCSKFGFRMV